MCKPCWLLVCFGASLLILVDGQLFNSTIVEPVLDSNEALVTALPANAVGGEPTFYGEFPFMAALGWTSDSGELSFHGGGMVISPKMILTAAHCVYRHGKIPDVVYVGGGNLSDALSNELADRLSLFSKFSVVNVTIFPQYNSRQAYHDIAILELDESIWFPPICLWNCDKLYTNYVSAIGYGLTEYAGMGSQQLLKVNLTIFPSDYCEPFFKRQRKFKLGLSKDHICAGDKDGKRDTCQGDSGGPLVIYHNNEMYAVGITSSGQACSGFPPAIYTKIQSYIKWITEVVEDRGEYLKQCDVCE